MSMQKKETTQTGGTGAERLMSLDALRGFDMFWIAGGGTLFKAFHGLGSDGVSGFIANQLSHRDWDGFVFEDLIFPLFVFMMGVAAVYSLGKIAGTEGSKAAHVRLLRRTVVLFLLGVFYSGGLSHHYSETRFLGVLQRIALCYGFAGLVVLHLKPRGMVAVFLALMLGYWALLTFVPAPGQATASFEVGKNWPNYIDAHFLPGKPYNDTWDPEGLLSTLPAFGSGMLGIFAGLLLRDRRFTQQKKAAFLFAGGLILLAVGYTWGHQFPIVKKIWTSTFVLVAGGYSCLLLAAFYWVIDIQGWRAWTPPFIWVGSNALGVYFAAQIIPWQKLAERLVGGEIQARMGAYGDLLIAVTAVTLLVLFARYLYKKQIFLRA